MSTSPFLFADLSAAETQATIRARLVANLAADGQPTASWAPSSIGGAENLRLDMVSGALASLASARIAALVQGRLLQTAADDPNTGFFLSYLGLRFYKLQKFGASRTVQNIVLTTVAGGTASSYTNGQLTVRAPATGNRYILALPPGQNVTLVPGGAASAPFQAENPGSSYLDPAGTVTQLVTGVAGVTVTNAAPALYRPTRQVGTSTGTVTAGAALVIPDSIRVRIDATGDIGSAYHSISTNDGNSWTSAGVIAAHETASGVPLTFANGSTPSFVQGSIFTIRAASNFLARGSDTESDALYRARLQNRWPALSLIPLKGHIELWSRAASPEVVRVSSDADTNIPGGILVTIASQTGPATPEAQEAVEDFIRPKLSGFIGLPIPTSPTVPGSLSPMESIQVNSASQFFVRTSATVTVPADQLASVQAAADEAWNEYLGSLPIGPTEVEMEAFYRILGDLGAVDVQGLTFNGAAADLAVGAGQVAVSGATLIGSLTWKASAGATVAPPAPPAPQPGSPFAPNPQSIADLLPPLSLDDVKAFLLAYLSVPANQVTDYESDACLRTFWEVESFMVQDLVSGAIQLLAAAGYPGTAEGYSLTLLADGWYDIQRTAPSAGTQDVTIFCDAMHGPYTAAQVATLLGTASDASTYHLTAGAASLASNASIVVTFTADVAGAVRALLSSVVGLPGVTVQSATITSFGSDGDGDAVVQAEVDARFPDLSVNPTQDRTITWALAAAPSPLITRFRLDSNPAVPGGVLMTLAKASGAVASGTVTAVQAALDALSPITDYNVAQNSTPHSITPSGTVTVRASLLVQAQAQADAAWNTYLQSAQIGSVIYLQALRQIVGDAIAADPASNFTNPALAGAGGDGNVALAATEVPVPSGALSALLTWVTT
jgi:hypothetical protein